MKEEVRVCKICSDQFKVILTGKKRSNGTMEALYFESSLLSPYVNCYPCFRSKTNFKYPQRKPQLRSYEKTKDGFLMRMYRNMKSRIIGVQKEKFHLYAGKTLLPKEEFYAWAESSHKFHDFFKEWEDSGYKRTLAPSVDRINSALGYEVSNMEWVTHSENSRRGAMAANEQRRLKAKSPI
jgi:hypothetical protein